jgi:hypothetical protein
MKHWYLSPGVTVKRGCFSMAVKWSVKEARACLAELRSPFADVVATPTPTPGTPTPQLAEQIKAIAAQNKEVQPQ